MAVTPRCSATCADPTAEPGLTLTCARHTAAADDLSGWGTRCAPAPRRSPPPGAAAARVRSASPPARRHLPLDVLMSHQPIISRTIHDQPSSSLTGGTTSGSRTRIEASLPGRVRRRDQVRNVTTAPLQPPRPQSDVTTRRLCSARHHVSVRWQISSARTATTRCLSLPLNTAAAGQSGAVASEVYIPGPDQRGR